MLIVSYVDGFDGLEYDYINQVLQELWTGDPQELNALIETKVEEVASYQNRKLLQEHFDKNAMELSTALNLEQKQQVKDLVIKLIKVDGKITGSEADMYISFKQLLE